MNDEVEDIEETAVTDVADRLCRLMMRIRKAASELEFQVHSHQTISGLQKPLHEVFGPLALALEFENYAELRDNFIVLCDRVSRDISALPVKRTETRDRWLKAVETARNVFEAENFGKPCSSVFDTHFSTEIIHRLEDISERLQTNGIKETSQDQLRQALDAARRAMKIYELHERIPISVAKILKHYLQQIETAYQRYNDFGEDSFWVTYKVLFATFVQAHEAIVPEKQGEDIREAITDMANQMRFGLPALSIAADVTTIATGLTVLAITAS